MKPFLMAALLALSLPVFAQGAPAPTPNPGDPASSQTQSPPAQRPKERFVDADTNHDGRLSRSEAEVMPFVSKHFDAIDTDHDGYVSRDELRAARERMQAMRAARQQNGGTKPSPQGSGGAMPSPNPDYSGTN